MSKNTIVILGVVAAIVVIVAVGIGIHHAINPSMPMAPVAPMK